MPLAAIFLLMGGLSLWLVVTGRANAFLDAVVPGAGTGTGRVGPTSQGVDPTASPPPGTPPEQITGASLGAASLAQQQVGRQYVWGGTGPNGFDCSGLVQWVYAQVGQQLPRTAQAQYQASQAVQNPQPGDLAFFKGTDPTSQEFITHVGIVIGNGQMVTATDPAHGVQIASLNNPYWQQHLVGYGRP